MDQIVGRDGLRRRAQPEISKLSLKETLHGAQEIGGAVIVHSIREHRPDDEWRLIKPRLCSEYGLGISFNGLRCGK